MRDWVEDWRRWSAAERVLAVALTLLLISLPLAVWLWADETASMRQGSRRGGAGPSTFWPALSRGSPSPGASVRRNRAGILAVPGSAAGWDPDLVRRRGWGGYYSQPHPRSVLPRPTERV